MNKQTFASHQDNLFMSCVKLREAGQKEYAQGDDAFDNFNRLAHSLKIDRKNVLWVYFQKHLDGILSYLKGHRSQRESVHGRIQDAIVYLTLLDAMILEEETSVETLEGPEIRGMNASPLPHPNKFGASGD